MTTENTKPTGADNGAAAATTNPPAEKKSVAGENTTQPGSTGTEQPADKVAGGDLYRPAGIPDHMVGATDHETIDKLSKVVEGYRKAQAEKGVPETAEGYTIDLPDEVKSAVFKFDDDGRDPVWDALTPVFHQHGLSNEAALAMVIKLAEVLPTLAGGEDAAAGEDEADFAFKAYGGADKARGYIDGVTAWANALKAEGKLTEDDVAEIGILTSYGRGLGLLSKIRVAMGGEPIPANLSGEGAADGLTEEALHEMMRDPRYLKRDKAYVAEVTEKFRQFYGGA